VSGFRISKWFGLIGVFVVAGICLAIGLSADPTDPNPKLQYGLIFGVIGAFLIVLFILQGRDLGSVERERGKAAASGPREVEDPTRVSEAELWAALAVKPVDSEAARARGEIWGAARRSLHLAVVVCLLIFLTVPPVYLFDTFLTLYIGVPLILAAAIYGSVRAVGSGGEVDQGFERLDRAMRPLGLQMVERPELRFEPRMPPMWGANARLRGHLLMEGERHGHAVSIDQQDGASTTTVKAASPLFEAGARDGRIRAGREGPEAVATALERIPGSTRWKGVKVSGGRGGIVVARNGDPGAWMCDLWLAERPSQEL
jgi:hypothetical protein